MKTRRVILTKLRAWLSRNMRLLSGWLAIGVLLTAGVTTQAATTLLVIGDTGDCDTDGAAKVAAALKRDKDASTAWFLELGDLAYPVATRERLLECHEPHFGNIPRRLAVPGNHDAHDPGLAGYYSIYPQAVPRWVDFENWRLLLLDSTRRDDAWERQLRWLDAEIEQAGKQCVIAAWHHPRWSSGRHGNNEFVAPLWQRLAGRAVFTLNGHDHHYEAVPPFAADGKPDPQGTPSFVVGIGGAKLYKPGNQAIAASKTVYGTWGYFKLTLDGDRYRWSAYSVDGQQLDAGDGLCRPAR
jgi:acid phosphatase type 7